MRLDKLIDASAGWAAARAHRGYRPDAAARNELAAAGASVLQDFLPLAGACVLMSAVYAARLRARGLAAFVVAGDLIVDRVRVFGDGKPVDGSVFDRTGLAWDGHAWVVLGDLVADVSVCRTVRLGGAHPVLNGYILRELPTAGMFIQPWGAARRAGLTYLARYVMTERQVAILSRSALLALPQSS